MGTTLTGKRVQNTYDSLIKISDNDNLTGVAKILGDGLGNDSPIYLSTSKVGIGMSPTVQFQTSGDAQIGNNLVVGGDLTVNGTTTFIDSTIVEIGDNMIELAKDNVANTKDIGWYGTINDGTEKYVGVFYDASTGTTTPTFRMGLGTAEPGNTATWTVKGKLIIGELSATAGTFSGLLKADTLELTSGADHLTFTESSGDWTINNSQQNNGITIYDGTGGIDINYAGSAYLQVDSNGVHTLSNIDFYVDTELIYADATNNLVGIGKTPSTYKLDVNGKIASNNYIIAGLGNGGVALTHNDGYGNANVTFNHVSGTPEQDGSSGRIVVTTDSTTAKMSFELKDDVTQDTAIDTPMIMELYSSSVVSNVDTNVRKTAGGILSLQRNDTTIGTDNHIGSLQFSGDDPTDGTFNAGARIRVQAEGGWSANNYPSKILLQTDNSGTLTTALTIDGLQNATFDNNVTALGGSGVSAAPLIIGSSSATNYTLQQWQTSAHGTNEAYIIAYGADHTTQANHFAMKNIEASGEIFFELAAGVEPLRLTSTNATFAGNVDVDGNLQVDGSIKDSDGDAGTSGQLLSSTGTGTNWIDSSADTAERTEILVKNAEGSALVKGDPVYIVGGVGASARLEVGLCDASDSSKMPCVGLLSQNLANNGEGLAIVTGKLRNLITSPIDGDTPTENDTIFVKPGGSSGAALTTTKPTATNHLIQNVGQVGLVSTTASGNLVVSAIMRTNDVPNLLTRDITIDGADFYFGNSDQIRMGDSIGLRLQHNGSHSYIDGEIGNMYFRAEANNSDMHFQADDGAGGNITYFRLDGGLATHDGTNTTQTVTVFPDNSKIQLGGDANGDLRLFHNGTNSIIANNTGNIEIINYSDDKDIIFKSDNGSGDVIEYFRVDGSESRVVYGRSPQLQDNLKIIFGNLDNANIRWDSTASLLFIEGESKFLDNVSVSANKYILIGTDSGDAFNASSAIRIQDDSHAYVQMKVGTSSQGGVLIGDTDDDYVGGFTYHNSTGVLNFKQNNVDCLTISGTQNAAFAGNLETTDGVIDIYKYTDTSASATGTTLLTLTNNVGTASVAGDLQTQKTFIDFELLDSNTNEIPQVRIGAEVGQNGNADSQIKEGCGAFVVYTNNATTDGTTPTGLAERFRVDYQGAATFTNHITTTELNLPSGGQVDWANGDARIVEGLVNNYSLSFQTYNGTAIDTALRLDGDNVATFENVVNADGFRSNADSDTYSLFTRDNVASNFVMYVQNALNDSTSKIARFAYGDAGANQGTEVFQIAGDGLYTKVKTQIVSDTGLELFTTTAAGSTDDIRARIKFSSLASAYGQFGTIEYSHLDSKSQGAGHSFHFNGTDTADEHLRIIAGDGTKTGTYLSTSRNSTAHADYGFYDDYNTGMYQPADNQLGFLANGSRKIFIDSTDVKIQNSKFFITSMDNATAADTDRVLVTDDSTGEVQYRTPSQLADDMNVPTGIGGAGLIPIYETTNTFTTNSNLYWDIANGRLGLGDSTPSSRLDIVTGTTDTTTKTLRVHHSRNIPDTATNAMLIVGVYSGTKTEATDVVQTGLKVDVDSSANGTAADEHRIYGIHSDTRNSGFADVVYGTYSLAESNYTGAKTAALAGVYGIATHDSSSADGGVSHMYGTRGLAQIQDFGDVDNAYGVHGQVFISNNRNANVDATHGLYGEIQIDEASALTYGAMYGCRTIIDNNEGAVPTFGNQFLFHGDYQGTRGAAAYGVYCEGDRHYLEGLVSIGNNNISGGIPLNVYHATNSQIRFTTAGTGTASNDGFRVGYNGTHGQLFLYENANIRIATNNTPFAYFTSNQRLGIGIEDAVYTLHAYHATTNVVARFESGDPNVWIDLHDSNSSTYGVLLGAEGTDFIIAPNNTQVVRVKENGRVGINTDDPSGDLHIKKTGDARLIIEADSDNVGENDNPTLELLQDGGIIGARFGINGDANNQFTGAIGNGGYIVSTGAFQIAPDNGLISATFSDGRMLIDGTAGETPNYKIDVRNAGSNGINISGTSAYLRWNAGDMQIRNAGGYTMAFDTWDGSALTAKMSISSGGTVHVPNRQDIGTQTWTGYGSNPIAELNVECAGNNAINIYNTQEDFAYLKFIDSQSNGSQYAHVGFSSGTDNPFKINNMGIDAIYILSDGKVGIKKTSSISYSLDVGGAIRASGDIIAYSDKRVKKDIVTIDNALEKVTKLRGVSYKRSDVPDNKTKVGVIAQEVEKVLPEVVSKDEQGLYSVSYGNMAGVFIEAIKDLKAEINELKEEIKQLKSK